MRPLRITCPDCGTTYQLSADLEGRKIRCKNCRHIMVAEAPVEPDDDDADEEELPRRRRKKKGMSGVSIALLVGGGRCFSSTPRTMPTFP